MSTDSWVVTYTFDIDPSMETMDEWADQLDEYDAAVAHIPGRGTDVIVHAPENMDIFDAVVKLAHRVQNVIYQNVQNVASADPIAMEVVSELEHHRRAEAPTMPELMSAAEIAGELGVARQRVHQLRQTATFPAPLAELRGGAVWDARAVRKFAQEWTRKPGRPAAAGRARRVRATPSSGQ